MVAPEHTIQIEQFRGPLDLLLHLITRAELDVTHISIAEITDRYLDSIRDLDRLDVDHAAEFLVLAATLVELKSRRLGDEPDAEIDPATGANRDDLASDLVRQLLRYKAYRDAADQLEARAVLWADRYPTARAAADRQALKEAIRSDEDADLEDLELVDIVEAYRHIALTVQLDRLGDHAVADDDTPIELHAADILDSLARIPAAAMDGGGHGLQSLFAGRNRAEMVGLFSALLELVRQRRVRVAQNDLDAEIIINLRPESEAEAPVGVAWEDDHIFGDDDEDDGDEDD